MATMAYSPQQQQQQQQQQDTVTGDWMYEDVLLQEVPSAGVRKIHETPLPVGAGSPFASSMGTPPPYSAMSASFTDPLRMMSATAPAARLPIPRSYTGKTQPGRQREAELLNADYLRQLLPSRKRTDMLSIAHRKRIKKRPRGVGASHGRSRKASRASRTSAPATGVADSARNSPTWLWETIPRTKTAPTHVLRERWRVMTAARQKPEVDEGTLDAQTRQEMEEEKAELAEGMGLSIDELAEMDAAVNDAENENDEEAYKRAFAEFDEDGSGDISPDELRKVISKLGVALPEDEIDKMIEEADEDGDGTIDYEEFVRMMKAKKTLLAMAKVLSMKRSSTRARSRAGSRSALDVDSLGAGGGSGAGGGYNSSASTVGGGSTFRSQSGGLPPLKADGRATGRRHHRQLGKHMSRPTPSVLRPGAQPSMMKLQQELDVSKSVIRVLNKKVKEDVAWVQANCPVTNIRAQMFCQRWGVEKMRGVMQRIHHSFLIAAFDKWLEYTDYKANQERAEAYLKYKGSRTLVNMFVNWKKKKCQTAWNSWMNLVHYLRAEERENSTIEIQRVVRGFVARRRVSMIHKVRGAIALQRIVRGFQAREYVEKFRDHMERDKAARYIQSRYRGYSGRKLLLAMLAAKRANDAVVNIQKIVRGVQARVRFVEIERQHELKIAAVELQRVARGYLGRQRVAGIRHKMARIEGAVAVQKVFRGFLGRVKASLVRRRYYGALFIQAWMRGVWGRRVALERKRLVKSIMIQCAWRVALAKMKVTFIRQTNAASMIQNCFRGRIARRTYYAMLAAKRKHDEQQHKAAVEIQRIARGYCTRRYMDERRQRELELDAAINIQRIIRGFLGRVRFKRIKDAKDRAEQEDAAALRIQTIYRGYCGRKIVGIKRAERDAGVAVERAKEEKLRAEEEARLSRLSAEARAEAERVAAEQAAAATRIQTMARARMARDRVHKLRRDRAATGVQRLIRGMLGRAAVRRLRARIKREAEEKERRKAWALQTESVLIIQCAMRCRLARNRVAARRKELADAAAKAEAERLEAERVAEKARQMREAMGKDAADKSAAELEAMVRAQEIIETETKAAVVMQAAVLGMLARKAVGNMKHAMRNARGKKREEMRLAALRRLKERDDAVRQRRKSHAQMLAARDNLVKVSLENASAMSKVQRIREAEAKNQKLFELWEKEEAIILVQCLVRRKLARMRMEQRKKQHAEELAEAEAERLRQEELERIRRRQQEEAAAAKMQALARGQAARKIAAVKREERDKRLREEEEARMALLREMSASKIQALYRGKRARAEVAVLREAWLKKKAEEEAERLRLEEEERKRLEEEEAARLEAELHALPEGWEEYWDETMQAYYYFNPATQEARWTKPGKNEGYQTAGTITDYETDNQNANTPICVECEYDYATRVCDQCEDNFCDACFDAAHATGRKQKHTWNPVAQQIGGVEVPWCIECEEVYATKRCDQCGDPYCDACFDTTHAKGRKREHTFSSVVQMCVECETNAATRACAQCMDPYCDECYDYTHRKGKKKLHTWTAVRATTEEAQEWLEYYDETYQRPYYYNPYTQETVWVDPRKK